MTALCPVELAVTRTNIVLSTGESRVLETVLVYSVFNELVN